MSTFSAIKDPDSTVDYVINWADWLGVDTISTVAWTVPAGLTEASSDNTTTTATAFLSGGTLGQQYTVVCRITTAGGRTADRSIKVKVRDK